MMTDEELIAEWDKCNINNDEAVDFSEFSACMEAHEKNGREQMYKEIFNAASGGDGAVSKDDLIEFYHAMGGW